MEFSTREDFIITQAIKGGEIVVWGFDKMLKETKR